MESKAGFFFVAHLFFSINDKKKSSPNVVVSGKSGAKQYSVDFFHFHAWRIIPVSK